MKAVVAAKTVSMDRGHTRSRSHGTRAHQRLQKTKDG